MVSSNGLQKQRKEEMTNNKSGKNGCVVLNGNQQQQQRIYLLEENGAGGDERDVDDADHSNPPHSSEQQPPHCSVDRMLLRPARVWRPSRERRTGWAWSGGAAGGEAADKSRKRLARWAAVAGTLALGIGLLLLLWLAMMPSERKEKGVKNGGQMPMGTNSSKGSKMIELAGISTLPPASSPSSTPNSLQNPSPSSNDSSISPSIFSTNSTFSNISAPSNLSSAHSISPSKAQQQKFRLSIVQPSGPNGSAIRRPNPSKFAQKSGALQQNVIRVTAPAGRQLEFDRMERIQNEEPKAAKKGQVWAQLEKGGEWGAATEGTTTPMGRMGPVDVPSMKNGGIEIRNDGGQLENGNEVGVEMNAQNGIGNASRANSSEESRTREEEDFDDLFWLRPAAGPKMQPMNSPNSEMSSSSSLNVPPIAVNSAPISIVSTPAESPQNHPSVPSDEIPSNDPIEPASTNGPMPTDGYEAKRPTIEFGPVRAESVERSDEGEMFGRTTSSHGGRRPQHEWRVPSDGAFEGNRPFEGNGPFNGNGPSKGPEADPDRVEEELNEIIASVEREPRPRPTPMFLNPRGRHHPSFGTLGTSSSMEEVHPVEIPFDPFIGPDSATPISPVPVWRRPPPDESDEEWSPPPPPMPKSAIGRNFTLQATVSTRQFVGGRKDLIKERQNLRRKRREAPVLVTALLDIGRGKWQRFTRHFDQYLGYLTNILLRLQNNIVVFCDPSVTAYLRALGNRTLDWERIQIVETSLPELPFYKYRPEIEEIMRWEQANWQRDWDAQMRAHPETLYPDYDILVNSKPYFLYNATQTSHFPRPIGQSEQFFAWLDAGYGHGSASAIPQGVWTPPSLRAGQITVVKLPTLGERVERYTLDRVYRKQRSVVSGGFLAGDDRVIRRFWTFFHKTFIELLDQRKVDDDQTTLLVTIQRYNSTFNLLKGGWFDAFKLLSSPSSQSSPSSSQ